MAEKDKTDEQIRSEKMEQLVAAGHQAYPEKFDKQQTLGECQKLPEGTKISTAGRLIMFRDMGKLTFAHLQDFSGRMQIAFQQDTVGKEKYKEFIKQIDLGDHIGVVGELFVTHKGELTINVSAWTFLGKALLPLPEKWHGLKDREVAYRQRYLDLIANPDTMKRFIFRSDFIRTLREFYWKKGFYEVETPTLLHKATGAHAAPYVTHNNALDIDVYLRISHELPLKEVIVGGFDKVFEIGKAFRNEGHDPSHLPEHTHIEHYCAYWNYEDNMKFTEEMFEHIFDSMGLDRKVTIKDREGNDQIVDFSAPFKRLNYVDVIEQDSGINITKTRDVATLLAALKKKKISIEGMESMSYATLVDNVFKKVSRPKIVGPAFMYYYPIELQPLARRNDADGSFVDQFQLIVNGWEVLKAYSELVDPIDQEKRFKEQADLKEEGDAEAMEGDDEFITAMKYGMPPISGWGMGIDRIVTLLTGQENLRDTVLFPLMRPKNE